MPELPEVEFCRRTLGGWTTGRRVSTRIVEGAGPSLSLAVPAFLLETLLAVSLALLCAFYRGSANGGLDVVAGWNNQNNLLRRVPTRLRLANAGPVRTLNRPDAKRQHCFVEGDRS